MRCVCTLSGPNEPEAEVLQYTIATPNALQLGYNLKKLLENQYTVTM